MKVTGVGSTVIKTTRGR